MKKDRSGGGVSSLRLQSLRWQSVAKAERVRKGEEKPPKKRRGKAVDPNAPPVFSAAPSA